MFPKNDALKVDITNSSVADPDPPATLPTVHYTVLCRELSLNEERIKILLK